MRYHYSREQVKDFWKKKKFNEDTIAVVKDVASGDVFITMMRVLTNKSQNE